MTVLHPASLTTLLVADDFLKTVFVLSKLFSTLPAGITGSTHIQHINHKTNITTFVCWHIIHNLKATSTTLSNVINKSKYNWIRTNHSTPNETWLNCLQLDRHWQSECQLLTHHHQQLHVPWSNCSTHNNTHHHNQHALQIPMFQTQYCPKY